MRISMISTSASWFLMLPTAVNFVIKISPRFTDAFLNVGCVDFIEKNTM